MRRLNITLSLTAALLSGCAAPRAPRVGRDNPVLRMQRDVNKIERAIEATKRLLALAHAAPYVPDLYLRLAELYAEQSRYEYLIAYENAQRKSKVVVSVPARLLKQQAVQLYDRVVREFPEYPELDKALFFKGHELRELGSYDEMIGVFERLVRDYPKSQFRHQALIILGDYYFDKSTFPRAEDYYKKVLADAEGPQHAMARYKLGWARQNQDDCKGALQYFEATARTRVAGEAEDAADRADNRTADPTGERAAADRTAARRKLDLRRESLVDAGYCFTEVKKPEEALPFYRGLATTRAVYVASLSRLARRYHGKGQYKAAAPLYREILEVDPTHEDGLEFIGRFYEGLSKSPSPGTVDRDVDVIVRVAEHHYFHPRTQEKTRQALVHDFELYARDLSTKAQLLAKDDAKLLDPVATAYERYLAFFQDVTKSKEAQAVAQNLADVLYAARRYIPAGRAYEAVGAAPGLGDPERKAALYSASAAYVQALKQKLNNYEQTAARAGLYRAGQAYISRFPTAENIAELKFNLANSLYEEGRFREAIARFTSLFEQFPTSKEGAVSAQLALDCYRLTYDMEGLVRAGQRMLAEARLKDEGLRQRLSDTVAAAQQRQLDVLTVTASASDKGTESLLTFAQKNAGSAIAERALLNAFVTAREQGDLGQMVKIADQLVRDYPKSGELPGVLGTVAKLTAQAGLFDEAARALTEASRREAAPARSQELLRTAGVLRAQRGDRTGAEEALKALQQGGAAAPLLTDVLLALAELYRHTGDGAALIELGRAAPQGPAALSDLRLDAIESAVQSGAPLERFAPDLRALSGAGGDVGAEARLLLLDLQRQQLEGVTFTAKRSDDAKVIVRRFGLQGQLEAQYLAVVKLQRPRQVVEALAHLSLLYQGGAAFLTSAPVPPGLSEADAKTYQAALSQKAQPLLKKAEEALKTCAETAVQLKVFSATARACQSGSAPPPFDPPTPGSVAARPSQPDAPALRARLLKNQGDGEALAQLALLHHKAGDLYGAKLVAERALEAGPGNQAGALHNLLGVVAYQMGEPAEAHRHFQDALKADKKNPRARLNLATLYREFGYGKLLGELGNLSDLPADLQRDPAVIQSAGPPAAPDAADRQEKK